jgi:DHA3 family macrolide efflux protein-like MFS transporter
MLNGGLNIISAPLGAILYEALDLQWILAIDFVTAVIAILPLFFFQIPQPDRTESEKLAGQASTYFQDLKAGFRYLWSWKGLLGIVLAAALLNFVLTPTFSLGPLLIKDHFGKTAISVGVYESVAGVGIILGGLLLSIWGGTKRKIVTTMGGIFFLGIGVLATGFVPAGYFYLAVAAAALMGLSLPIANGTLGGIMQSSVAPDMQGRVFSLVNSLASGMAPIGLMLAGPVADLFGIQSWYLVAGFVTIGMAVFGFLSPAIMGIESNNPGKLASEEKAVEPASAGGIQEQAAFE